MCAGFFCLSEIDRISGKNTVKEAQELRKGYQGSIRYAECARQLDAAKIRQEIDEQTDEAKGFRDDCCLGDVLWKKGWRGKVCIQNNWTRN